MFPAENVSGVHGPTSGENIIMFPAEDGGGVPGHTVFRRTCMFPAEDGGGVPGHTVFRRPGPSHTCLDVRVQVAQDQ